ncbi:MAG: hypothetical protein IPN89_10865 [Saprospiraceae bacterium]|nr:hypothetical protein [Saprospiraceae bacterium]
MENSPNDAIFYESSIKMQQRSKIINENELGNYKGQILTVSVRDICGWQQLLSIGNL